METCSTSPPPEASVIFQPALHPQSSPQSSTPPHASPSMASTSARHFHSPSPSSSVPTSSPGTPCRGCQRHCSSSQGSDLGHTSVVTFSYIEKAMIKKVESPHSALREEGGRPRKRFSGSAWSCSNNSPFHQQSGSPPLHRATVDSVGRAATQRALEDFGSPQLRSKFARGSDWSPGSQNNQQARCQSWSGNTNDIAEVLCGQASNRLSSNMGHSTPPLDQNSNPRFQKLPNQHQQTQQSLSSAGRTTGSSLSGQKDSLVITNPHAEGLNQLSGSNNSSTVNSPAVAHRLAEEATKVSVIFDEVRKSPSHNVFGGQPLYCPPNHESPVLKMNIPVHGAHPESPVTNGAPPYSQVVESSTNQSSEARCELTNHSKTSIPLLGALDSPALPSRLMRPWISKGDVGSPLRDPRLHRSTESPSLHRRRPPQFTGWSPEKVWDMYTDRTDHAPSDSMEISRRLLIGQRIEEAPVSWTSMQTWWEQNEKETEMFRPGEKLEREQEGGEQRGRVESVVVRGETVGSRSEGGVSVQQRRQEEWRRRQALLLGPVVLEGEHEERAEGEQNGAPGSSPSSSGVTGSLGDRECVSPESTSNSNQTEHASSGIQVRLTKPLLTIT